MLSIVYLLQLQSADKAEHGDSLCWFEEEQVENQADITAAPLLLVKP